MALAGIKVIELAGLAPGPFAGMVLADFGANVIRVDRTGQEFSSDMLSRGKRSISIDLKQSSGKELLKKMISKVDVLIDPFRPGVMEKLGLGPDVFLGKKGINKRLIYARLAGFDLKSSYKDMAGHDLNYLALSGALAMLPGSEAPNFPLNLLADFGGGGMMCAIGILLALQARSRDRKGQVVQTDMVSGARYLSAFPLLHAAASTPLFYHPRGHNMLDGGAPFYSIYRCAEEDPKYMTVACLEPQFFKAFWTIFIQAVPLDASSPLYSLDLVQLQSDRECWTYMRSYLTEGFRSKSRDDWAILFHGTDACAVPVLMPEEAAADTNGSPLPHPILSRTPANTPPHSLKPLIPGKHTHDILGEFNITNAECRRLGQEKAVAGLAGRSPFKL